MKSSIARTANATRSAAYVDTALKAKPSRFSPRTRVKGQQQRQTVVETDRQHKRIDAGSIPAHRSPVTYGTHA